MRRIANLVPQFTLWGRLERVVYERRITKSGWSGVGESDDARDACGSRRIITIGSNKLHIRSFKELRKQLFFVLLRGDPVFAQQDLLLERLQNLE